MNARSSLSGVYLGGFLLAVHYATVAYLNSSLLTQYWNNTTVNLAYILGSILSIGSLWLAPLFLKRYGNVATLLFFGLVESFAVFGLGSLQTASLVFLLFLIQMAAEPMLYFCLDVSLEQATGRENTTGNKRGLFLTFQNVAWVLSPLCLSAILFEANWAPAYFLSGAALLSLLIVAPIFFKRTTVAENASDLRAAFLALRQGGDAVRIIGAHFVLNFFYSWMIIYLPLLLNLQLGFDWSQIGLLLTIMLLPFLLFELPAGIIADRKLGEKEFLISGFIMMALSTTLLAITGPKTVSIVVWGIILFSTRIGAALVEVSGETYFFKQVKERDVGLISLFRMARPMSFIVAPLVALPIVHFFSYSTSFLFLSLFTLVGLFFIPQHDTR